MSQKDFRTINVLDGIQEANLLNRGIQLPQPTSISGLASTITSSLESRVEEAIVRSNQPINVNENEEITVLGQRGIWVNKSEVLNWNGPVPISQYKLNEDANPEVVHKAITQPVEYTQEIQVKYLRPPTPPPHGELIIRQESGSSQLPAAPPQIIRQTAARPATPEPLVIREAPPDQPAILQRKVVTIKGNTSTIAPPRKVIIEKLPALPAKPQPVIIERWLPYKEQKRKVIFQAQNTTQTAPVRVRNTIVQWSSPNPVIKKDIKYLGVVRADPREYVSRYGNTLKRSSDLPSFVVELENNNGYQKYVKEQGVPNELEGDIDALRYLDLDREGLSMYRHYLRDNNSNARYASAVNVGPIGLTTTTTEIHSSGSLPYYTSEQRDFARY